MNLESVWRCASVAVFLGAAACASGPRTDAASAPPLETDQPDAGAARAEDPETPVTSPAAPDDIDALFCEIGRLRHVARECECKAGWTWMGYGGTICRFAAQSASEVVQVPLGDQPTP